MPIETYIPMKQIATAAPTTALAPFSNHPYLFGCGEDGQVYFWDWNAKQWSLLNEIDN